VSARTARNETAALFAADILSHVLGHPVTQLEIFPDFAALMTILERLFGVMFGFAERMFLIANIFAHYFECFHHNMFPVVYRTYSRFP
jgi:hypothetical protein